MITWAVGHLVGLADPEAYDEKLKKWKFDHLPIVPEKFKLVPNEDKAKKQLQAVHRLMKSDEIDLIVNACDAGREGELIFAYTYETSGVRKPVKRLWLNSMTKKAIEAAFQQLRDGEEMRLLEEAARSRSEAGCGERERMPVVGRSAAGWCSCDGPQPTGDRGGRREDGEDARGVARCWVGAQV